MKLNFQLLANGFIRPINLTIKSIFVSDDKYMYKKFNNLMIVHLLSAELDLNSPVVIFATREESATFAKVSLVQNVRFYEKSNSYILASFVQELTFASHPLSHDFLKITFREFFKKSQRCLQVF